MGPKALTDGIAGDQAGHKDADTSTLERIPGGLVWLPSRRRYLRPHLCGKRSSAPSPFLQQAFEILTGGKHQSFTVGSPKPPEAKTPHPMPILPFRKERFDPDFALVHGFLVGQGLMVPLHALQIGRKKGPMQVPTALA